MPPLAIPLHDTCRRVLNAQLVPREVTHHHSFPFGPDNELRVVVDDLVNRDERLDVIDRVWRRNDALRGLERLVVATR